MDDDATLVRLARHGDRGAFARLVDRHAPLLRATTRRAAADEHLAADAAQEAVLTAMLSLDRLRDDNAFGPWLAGIGLNATRHLTRERRGSGFEWGHDEAADPLDVDAALDDQRAAARIRRAIATLPPGQRDAVALFYLAGLTHAEAAAHLGVPPSAVKTRLHKARANLRRRLDPLWKEQFAMPEELVPMHVADVRRGDGHHVVLLAEDAGEGRTLPIWIGPPEAIAIAGLLERVELPRPGPYDFAAALLGATSAAVEEVRISRLDEKVFYADVVLSGGATVDARPSDAIALALTAGAPIRVDAAVLAQATDAFGDLTHDRHVLAQETRDRLARLAEELEQL